MSNPQVLEKPLQLKVGAPALLKINGHILCVTVISDANGVVEYTYPLRPSDKTVHSANKCDIYCPLSALCNFAELSLPFSAAHRLKTHLYAD